MSVLEIIRSRHSVRDFTKQDIPAEAIDSLIEAMRWAPSAGNLQSRKFYFVFNNPIKKQIARAALDQNFIAEAPLVVVACVDRRITSRYRDRGVSLYAIEDVSASVMSMMLVAQELGLGSVWIGAFNEVAVFKILDMPDYLRPIALIPVGYPLNQPGSTSRKSGEEVVEYVK